jgi:hypothetical protein
VDDLTQNLALMLGASWASGINLYAAILVLGIMGATGAVDLPAGLQILSDPLVLLAAGAMYLAEFVADKVPGVDTIWDGLHTFIRIPAGALLAMGAVGDVGPLGDTAVALLGGGVAAASHLTKASTRVLINSSPEPFTNWIASVTEDLGVLGGLLLALKHPAVFLVVLALFFLLLIWLLPRLWRGIKRVFAALRRHFSGDWVGDRASDRTSDRVGGAPAALPSPVAGGAAVGAPVVMAGAALPASARPAPRV